MSRESVVNLLLAVGVAALVASSDVSGQDGRRGRQVVPPRPPIPEAPEPGPARDRDGVDGRDREDRRDLRLLPPDRDRGDWSLGVQVDNTRTGVLVTRVVPGTAAARAGLERNDRIVAVDGYQVGYLGRQLYDLGDELDRRADRRGRVTLLVQNNRNAELTNIEVQLDPRGERPPRPPRGETLGGSVTFRERIAIPPNVTLTVLLREEAPGRPATTIAQESFGSRGGRIPTTFELSYDPEQIRDNRTYTLTAVMSADGRALLGTASPVRVLTGGHPRDNVSLVLQSVR